MVDLVEVWGLSRLRALDRRPRIGRVAAVGLRELRRLALSQEPAAELARLGFGSNGVATAGLLRNSRSL